MADALRLILFDVDGTLIDSAGLISAAMAEAFSAAGRRAPTPIETRTIIGLSLPIAVARLDPDLDPPALDAVTAAYKAAFVRLRATGDEATATPLFPGARAALERGDASGALMGVATGKARRGLEHILDGHDLRGFFVTTQTADDAPSKPHPGMVLNALRATGVDGARAAVVGDTSYDMAMARAGGAAAIGVAWGCHHADALIDAGAQAIIESFEALDDALERLGVGA
ncbi:HAD-IA family hydrolase [Rubrimonas cliftonensis]|uniref:Phosphoglycolate phosphatase n=1 Tax=Rubrimonas cliftonensis TaxID=89524 RepID=A0A1H3VH20_9RHOB|nr:HAD-IA family hydrolase [Rubrimonas cliftonensis]SDZ74030.1 phosphoglycolate phosphatase [Rubrimonas cliftonensis]